MKNIPVFTTPSGTASLILKEIPYRGVAHVLPRFWSDNGLLPLLQESAAFCRAAGARQVYASLQEPAAELIPAWNLVTMSADIRGLSMPEHPVGLEAATEQTMEEFRSIYNRCFQDQPAAETCTVRMMRRRLKEERCFLAVQNGRYAGIGQLQGNELRAVGVLPEFRGLGTPLVRTLLTLLPGPEAEVLVSTENTRAVALYQRLGFRQTAVKAYCYTLDF